MPAKAGIQYPTGDSRAARVILQDRRLLDRPPSRAM